VVWKRRRASEGDARVADEETRSARCDAAFCIIRNDVTSHGKNSWTKTNLSSNLNFQSLELIPEVSVVSSEFLNSPVNDGLEFAVERRTHVANI